MRKLWGGRFDGQPDALIDKLNNSLSFDARLWREDVEGSIAHAAMLGAAGILSETESSEIVAGLKALAAEIENGDTQLPEDAEDVHTAVEGLLRERIGPAAGKLHTARSRNDQVATDIRLYLRRICDSVNEAIHSFQTALADASERELGVLLPGYTHMQHAQPILLSHQLLAYFWMLDRDRERFTDCRGRINRMPLGAGALAGTGFPINRRMTAESLGFDSILPNSLDAVSDRDFAIEFLAAAAILMMHISRLAEEIILWNSPEFGFILLDDSVTTGSSIMPQKKNPDAAELSRGKAGRVYGDLITLLTVMKGLPLAYNKDMQEDKEPLFDAADTLLTVIPAMEKTLATAKFQAKRMEYATKGDFSTATEAADYLARCGLPFREAHEVIGRLVRHCMEHSIGLEELDAGTLLKFSPLLKPDVLPLLSPAAAVEARSSQGGSSSASVREQLILARIRLERK